MDSDFKQKLVEKLEARLKRTATANEKVNAETDQNLVNEVILDQLAQMRTDIDNIKTGKTPIKVTN